MLLFILTIPLLVKGATFNGDINKKDVFTVCDAVTKWQLSYPRLGSHHALDWTRGALYRGIIEWWKVSKNEAAMDYLTMIGYTHRWQLLEGTPYHADDICVGQTFIELYRIFGKDEMLRPTMERAFWIANHPSDAPMRKDDPVGTKERWSWCDALFMAPPVYAALYAITGEKVYIDYMDKEFKACTDALYDTQEKLYYRDNMRIPLRELNGNKQFWGRGNGWVFAGIPLILNELPTDHPTKKYYLDIFTQMADAIVATQDSNGAWHASLLAPESYPSPENSCSAFFCYGLAWGLNNDVIKGRKYEDSLKRGWKSLVSCVSPIGKVGYIQPVGHDPKQVDIESTDVYGVGAFLIAGSEIYKLALK